MELYLKKPSSGVSAVGEYDFEAGTMTVKKGSTVSENVHSDGKFRSAKSVARYREAHCEGATVKEDVVFKSASTAANFITGRSTNGLIAWKDADRKSVV